MDAVNMEKASSKTPMIAVINMANKCQASGVMSQGTGRCHITTPSITVSILLVQSSFWEFPAIASNEVEISWYRYIPKYEFHIPIPIQESSHQDNGTFLEAGKGFEFSKYRFRQHGGSYPFYAPWPIHPSAYRGNVPGGLRGFQFLRSDSRISRL